MTATTLFDAADGRRGRITFRTHRKLHEHVRRWQKAGCPVQVRAVSGPHFEQFRQWALGQRKPLANTTIEATVRDVLSLIREHLPEPEVPSAGRPLNQRFDRKPVPTVSVLGETFSNADSARWPNVWNSKTPELTRVSNGEFWRATIGLAYFTGLRLKDLMSVRWEAVESDAIRWRASKTSKAHEYPLPEVLRQLLEPLRATMADRILPVPAYAMGRIRRELKRISGDRINGAQAIRRLSVTQWAIASPEAGRIVHGTGLGVLDHYYDQQRILSGALPRFEWPDEILSFCGVTRETERRLELNRALKRLPDDRIDDVLRIARAFSA